jgi:hypothetical protein
MRRTAISLAVLGLTFASPLAAQPRQDPASLLAAQRQAMTVFARMDGVWRGPAWSVTPNGRHEITQTERIGTFLGGSVRMIEGRGYNADGSVGFNALGIISFHADTNSYTISSWALGRGGVFPFRPTADGYEWEVPAGPGTTIRYTATVTADTLREVGFLTAGTAAPVQIFEMNLRRIGTTDWPGAGAVPMR